ncbi:amino acid ABC transporter permease [Oenococcus oeni]|uniref:amino acid ABC transporter permease n=1 Tax=Oenococcus oeni TaxID=1247 RepID=UPI000277B494|nr:amino acid ABC transporter permease [Oenococcus oeni]EJO04860.1 polar amino acid ABC transporter inner membrane subunit [Oenococcus oeni AWRIB548]EJO08215.1 polar amino acid ABC transporter inner membrane subunit [Oenococcus oeni AWRIB422]KEP86427.1 amino acid ABC transporter permease [Oenococcus oeni IOEB_0205]KGH67946.1 arginine ABC transporter permease [Oenococcus oeni IOEB_B16]OIL79901.1 arginine ABC transporter permease [Oenococcus oeni]
MQSIILDVNLWKFRSELISGIEVTLLISICAVVLGSIIGLFIAIMHMSKKRVVNVIATTYVEILRGTPLIVQLMFVYYAVPLILQAILSNFGSSIEINIPTIPAGIIAVAINSSAYVSEAIRAGFNSIDKGQTEAARSLGLPKKLTMRYVIIPQALKNIWPALGNEFVALIKESSIVLVIGTPDIMYQINNIRAVTFEPVAPLILSAVIYFVLTFGLTRIMKYFEGKMQHD